MKALARTQGLLIALAGLFLLGLGRCLAVAALALVCLAVVLVVHIRARHQRRAVRLEP